jgi:hypothetical protein
MRVQLQEDQNEIVEASPHTHTGGTGFAHGAVTRTRDRQAAEVASQPESARPKSEVEQAADFYYDLHLQREAKKKADEQDKLRQRAEREQQEKAAAELKQRRATTAFQEAQVLRECSDLTPDESQLFWTRLAVADKMLDVEFATMVAEIIRSSRVV